MIIYSVTNNDFINLFESFKSLKENDRKLIAFAALAGEGFEKNEFISTINYFNVLRYKNKSDISLAFGRLRKKELLIYDNSWTCNDLIVSRVIEYAEENGYYGDNLATIIIDHFNTGLSFALSNSTIKMILLRYSLLKRDKRLLFESKKAYESGFGFIDDPFEVAIVIAVTPMLAYSFDSDLFEFIPEIYRPGIFRRLFYRYISNKPVMLKLYNYIYNTEQNKIYNGELNDCWFLFLFGGLDYSELKQIKSKYIDMAGFVEHLIEGDVSEAVNLAREFAPQYHKAAGSRKKVVHGFLGVFYCLALLLDNDKKSDSTVGSYIKGGIKYSDGFVGSFYTVLDGYHKYLQNDRFNAERLIKEAVFNDSYPYLSVFAQSVSVWTDIKIFPDSGEKFNAENINFYSEWELNELKTICKDINFSNHTFENSYKSSLADLVKPKEEWENVVNAIKNLKLKGDKKKNSADVTSRLIWEVDFTHGIILPYEQKKNAKGWTAGRKVSLNRIMKKQLDCMTDKDIGIADNAIKAYGGYYGGEMIDIDFASALPFLVGHPNLYMLKNRDLNLELVKSKPEIDITQEGDSVIINFSPDLFTSSTNIIAESITRYRWIEITYNQVMIGKALGRKSPVKIPMSQIEAIHDIIDVVNPYTEINSTITHKDTERVDGNSDIIIQIVPYGEGLKAKLLVRPLTNEGSYFAPGDGKESYITRYSDNQVLVVRDLDKEKEGVNQIIALIPAFQEMIYTTDTVTISDVEDSLQMLLDIREKTPDINIEWPEGQRFNLTKVLSSDSVHLSISKVSNWFDLSGEVKISEDEVISMQQFLKMTGESKGRFMALTDDRFIALTDEFRKRINELYAFAEIKNDEVKIHHSVGELLTPLADSAGSVNADKEWKDHIKRVEQIDAMVPVIPSTLQAELRPYQVEGYNWMSKLDSLGLGCCLADDMGLGKTVQALAMILSKAQDGPTLVVSPASVCANWRSEILRFAPSLNIIDLKSGKRKSKLENLKAFDIVVISYGFMQSNTDVFTDKKWTTVVLDEAHAIKNRQTKRAKAAMQLDADFKLITTGTPIQNHLGELWSLFNFINPGLLGSEQSFAKKFVTADSDEERRQKQLYLKKLINPFILRRNKNMVLDDLPQKTEITINVEMSDKEMAFYETLRRESVDLLDRESDGAEHMRVLAEITKLRMASCNPQLIMPDSDIPSAKLEQFERIITDLIENRHKALVFSQFVTHLNIIEKMLKQRGINYQYLDGKTTLKEREKRINSFQAGEGDLFLISLKAGGVGLNLTAADYVIHMDPWWNPAIEDQASDRAHRIGQERPVTVYRLVSKGTIEERIINLHTDKRDLADSLLEGTDVSAKITAKDLIELMKQPSDK
jgi:SNF2 family DNA or RNA helicase